MKHFPDSRNMKKNLEFNLLKEQVHVVWSPHDC